MIKIFAIEPEIMADPVNFDLLFRDFGSERGRWIAELPSKWRKKVIMLIYKSPAGTIPPVKRNAMADKIRKYNDRFQSVEVSWDNAKDWLENAIDHHRRNIIDAVISKVAVPEQDSVLGVEECQSDSADCDYSVKLNRRVERKPEELFDAIATATQYCTELHLVDQYFECDGVNKASYVKFLELLFEQQRNRSAPVRDIFFHLKKPDSYDESRVRANYSAILQSILKTGERIILKFWEEHPGGDKIHDRYLYTERVMIDSRYGWGEGSETGHRTTLTLLDRAAAEEIRASYGGNANNSCPFPHVLGADCTIIISSSNN
ncbi:MAG: hypothetical protein AB3N14_01675 [Flavobacteriaceae bacterium]